MADLHTKYTKKHAYKILQKKLHTAYIKLHAKCKMHVFVVLCFSLG